MFLSSLSPLARADAARRAQTPICSDLKLQASRLKPASLKTPQSQTSSWRRWKPHNIGSTLGIQFGCIAFCWAPKAFNQRDESLWFVRCPWLATLVGAGVVYLVTEYCMCPLNHYGSVLTGYLKAHDTLFPPISGHHLFITRAIALWNERSPFLANISKMSWYDNVRSELREGTHRYIAWHYAVELISLS